VPCALGPVPCSLWTLDGVKVGIRDLPGTSYIVNYGSRTRHAFHWWAIFSAVTVNDTVTASISPLPLTYRIVLRSWPMSVVRIFGLPYVRINKHIVKGLTVMTAVADHGCCHIPPTNVAVERICCVEHVFHVYDVVVFQLFNIPNS